jgi:hypothetical protein
MATIKTYVAPVEHIRPSDLTYTSNIQLARRESQYSTEQAAALKAGGAVAAQTILSTRKADVALMDFLNPTSRSRGGGGGGGGSLGSRSAPRQEAARAANALVRTLAPPALSDQPDASAPPPLHHYWDTNPFPTPKAGPLPTITFGGQGLAADPYGLNTDNSEEFRTGMGILSGETAPSGAIGATEPQPAAGGNYQQYGYGTGGGETVSGEASGSAAAPAPASTFQSWVNWATGGANADAGGSSDTFQGPN